MRIKASQMKKRDMEPLAVSPREAMSLLGVGRNLIYRLLATGELPARKVGRRWVVPIRNLEEWLQRKEG